MNRLYQEECKYDQTCVLLQPGKKRVFPILLWKPLMIGHHRGRRKSDPFLVLTNWTMDYPLAVWRGSIQSCSTENVVLVQNTGWWYTYPLKNMKVNWDDEIPNSQYMEKLKKNVPNHQPDVVLLQNIRIWSTEYQNMIFPSKKSALGSHVPLKLRESLNISDSQTVAARETHRFHVCQNCQLHRFEAKNRAKARGKTW